MADEEHGPVNDWLVDKLAPQPGADHPGSRLAPAISASWSPSVGDEGKVLSTDFSPEMVDVARRRARRAG